MKEPINPQASQYFLLYHSLIYNRHTLVSHDVYISIKQLKNKHYCLFSVIIPFSTPAKHYESQFSGHLYLERKL